MRFKEEKDEESELQMGPMIDCVFLLLLYFISAAQIKIEEKYLGLMVPGSSSGTAESLPQELTLAIAENNQIFVNEVPMDSPTDRDLPMVRARLNQVLELFGEKQPVVIHPQPKVRHQRIIDVLNACSASGVKNLSFFAN